QAGISNEALSEGSSAGQRSRVSKRGGHAGHGAGRSTRERSGGLGRRRSGLRGDGDGAVRTGGGQIEIKSAHHEVTKKHDDHEESVYGRSFFVLFVFFVAS